MLLSLSPGTSVLRSAVTPLQTTELGLGGREGVRDCERCGHTGARPVRERGSAGAGWGGTDAVAAQRLGSPPGHCRDTHAATVTSRGNYIYIYII